MQRTIAVLCLSLAGHALGQGCPIPIVNASFESGAGSLANPLVAPPLSGTLGSWLFERSGPGALTGLTVPRMGIAANSNATTGTQAAFVQFVINVDSAGRISQQLTTAALPAHRYTLAVDVASFDTLSVVPDVVLTLTAGGQTIGSSTTPGVLQILQLTATQRRFILTATSGPQVSGNLGVSMSATSVAGAAAAVIFDTVTLNGLPLDCYANCDQSEVCPILNVNDFACFLNRFAAGDPYANCDNSTIAPTLNVLDFGCFLNKFAAGCP